MEPPAGMASAQPLASTLRTRSRLRGPQPTAPARAKATSVRLTDAGDIVGAGGGERAGEDAGADGEDQPAGERHPQRGATIDRAARRRQRAAGRLDGAQ